MVIVNLTLVVLYLNGGKLTRSDRKLPYSESNWILLRVEIEEKELLSEASKPCLDTHIRHFKTVQKAGYYETAQS